MEPTSLTLIVAEPAALTELHTLTDQARAYIADARAANTRRTYASAWAHFTSWCADRDLAALPAAPATVALYLVDLARDRKVSTLTSRLSAIAQAHKTARLPSPAEALEVREIMKGIRRTKGSAQTAKTAALTEDIKAMIDTLDDTPIGVRNRALLLLGFAGAFRRSELVALTIGDLTLSREGYAVRLKRSKTDQEGEGFTKGIPYGRGRSCPVAAVRAWLELLPALGLATGPDEPLFRSYKNQRWRANAPQDRTVAEVVKIAAAAAGLDPAKYAGHSLRSGLATSAAARGVSERAIMRQTGHKDVKMVRRYIQAGDLFRENAAGDVGL